MLLSTAKSQSITTDSLAFSTDTILSENALEEEVVSFAQDSIDYDVFNKKVYLYHEAWVEYGSVRLTAAYIELDSENNTVYATGLPDSTGSMYGYPVFKESGKDFSAKEIQYNFKTKRAYIKEIITKEGDGYIHGEKVKKQANDVVHTHLGRYTTCDAEEPHFAIRAKKIKTIPGEKIITGPANLEFGGAPTPLFIPFGFFPNQQKQSSGLIFPSYGESTRMGFFLKNGGYYFAINDYLDLAVTGDLFTKGSWRLRAHSNYKKRYKYNGSLDLSYASNKTGSEELENLNDQRDFFIKWRHQQDQKASPNSSFSANVNAGSSTFHANSTTTNNDYLKNTFESNVSYSKNYSGYNFSTALKHSQNTLNNSIYLELPSANFNINKFYPFKGLNKSSKKKWYDKVNISYKLNSKNQINTIDSLLLTSASLAQFENGIKHYIPISGSFKALQYFNLTPSVSYTERWYFNHINKYWDGQNIQEDTLKGFKRAYNYGFSTSLSTKLYGMLQFKGGKVRAIRHVASPSLTFRYNPDFSNDKYGFYQKVQSDSLGGVQQYSIFQNGIYGTPGSRESGNITFNLGNILEMKVNSKDTVETLKKIKLLEAINLSTSYNIFADSMNFSLITLSGRTRLFNAFTLNFNSVYDFYALDGNGNRINEYYFKESYKFARFTNAGASINFSLNQKGNTEEDLELSWLDYVDFDIPWNLSASYSIDYNKSTLNGQLTQTLGFSGDLKLTDKWKIGFKSGYDFKAKDLSFASVDIYRDLHCWEMLFNWIPFGYRQSYNFTIRVKSSVLQDLKWEKKKDWYDY